MVDGCRAPRLRRHAPWRSLHVMGQRIATVVVSAVSALWSTSAWAHTPGPAPILPAPFPNPSTDGFDVSHGVWIVAALAAVALLVAAACRRKTLGAALIALTLWMGFEAGAHSVHHLWQPSEESRCAVASVTAHGTAIPSEVHACVAVLLGQTGIARDTEPGTRGRGLPATHEGRAPPRLAL